MLGLYMHGPVIPVIWRLKQDSCKFLSALGNFVRSYRKIKSGKGARDVGQQLSACLACARP